MKFLDEWASASYHVLCCVLLSHLAVAVSADCTVEQKIVRDGILGVPLPPGTPAGDLALSALGKIQDSTLQDRYSVWEISNPGSESLRVVLQDVESDYRIPILARAGTATLVRSDRAIGTVAHQLLVESSIVSTVVSSNGEYSNETMLDDAACAFEGNPLYVAEQSGSLKISTMHGATVAEIPSTAPVTALVTEQPGGELWALANNVLRSFAPSGAPQLTLSVPVAAYDAKHLIVEEGTSIWLARGSTLYRLGLPHGALLADVTYPEPIRGLTHDVRNGRVWVLLETSSRIVRSGSSPAIVEVASVTLPGKGRVLAYDSFWSETWVGTASSLARHDASGSVSFEVPSASIFATDHLVADGSGGVWAVNGAALFHVDSAGNIDAQLQPFQGLADTVVSIAADPADGSVWVAGQTRIRNFSRQETLLQDVQPRLADGVIRQLGKLELFADRSPPRVWIATPAHGAILNSLRPPISVEYDAQDVAPATLELRLGDENLWADCTPHQTGVDCTLNEDLPTGEISVVPHAHDLAGNQSISTPSTFTVTVPTPPLVWVYEPMDYGIYTQPNITFSGELSDPAVLTINGEPVSLDEGTLVFAHAVTLQEGQNIFTIAAENPAGRARFEMVVTLDTTAPLPPVMSSISVSAPDNSYELRVEGAPGAVEPYVIVRIRNLTDGSSTEVYAQEDGSFSATLDGQYGHEIYLSVVDDAGNESPTGEQQIDNSGLIPGLYVESPIRRTDSSHVTINGWLAAAPNTGVTVNGIAANIVSSDLYREFRARVPLTAGMNVITVIAKRHLGAQVVRTVQVERRGTPPFSVVASPTEGTGPLDVVFTIERHVGHRIVSVEMDFDSDGVSEVNQTAAQTRFEHRYLQPGNYTAWVRIVHQPNSSQAQLIYVDTIPIGVMTNQAADGQIQGVWQRFKQALVDGDSATALQYMTAQAAAEYQPILAQLQPQMPAIASSFSVPQATQFLPGMAEYIVRRTVGTSEQAFFVYFRRAPDGTWRVASM